MRFFRVYLNKRGIDIFFPAYLFVIYSKIKKNSFFENQATHYLIIQQRRAMFIQKRKQSDIFKKYYH